MSANRNTVRATTLLVSTHKDMSELHKNAAPAEPLALVCPVENFPGYCCCYSMFYSSEYLLLITNRYHILYFVHYYSTVYTFIMFIYSFSPDTLYCTLLIYI